MGKSKEILVAKFGSSALTGADGTSNHLGVNSGRVGESVRQLAELSDRHRIVVVHSGAVAVGNEFATKTKGAKYANEMDDTEKASAGSALITAEFQDWFAENGIMSGQALLTHHEIEGKNVGASIIERIIKMLAKEDPMIPLVNENDFVSDEELKKLAYGGDNDGLASHVARAIDADRLLLLTDEDGFKVDGLVVPQISYDKEFELIVDNLGEMSEDGTGGMFSKVENAAEFVEGREGRSAHIGNVTADYEAILAGSAGTMVLQ